MEGNETFGISVQLPGADANDRVLIANEVYAVVIGRISEATVTIADDNGK